MTDEAQALAEQLIDATGVVDTTLRAIDKFISGLGIPTNDAETLRARIRQAAVVTYANVHTETELRETLAFSQSPVGRSIQAKGPVVEAGMQAAVEAAFSEYLGLNEDKD